MRKSWIAVSLIIAIGYGAFRTARPYTSDALAANLYNIYSAIGEPREHLLYKSTNISLQNVLTDRQKVNFAKIAANKCDVTSTYWVLSVSSNKDTQRPLTVPILASIRCMDEVSYIYILVLNDNNASVIRAIPNYPFPRRGKGNISIEIDAEKLGGRQGDSNVVKIELEPFATTMTDSRSSETGNEIRR